jgi:hypothetical protein
MQLTRERPHQAQRGGLFRRILLGHQGEGAVAHRDGPGHFIDLRSSSSDLEEANERIERLEMGMRLIAETMKRTYGRLAAAVEQMGGGAVVGTTIDDVQQVVADALLPVATALGEVAETLRTFPYLVAAAADHVTERVDAARAAAESQPQAAMEQAPRPEIAILPVVPFELESVEEDFDRLTALRRARFALDDLATWDGGGQVRARDPES